MSEVKVTRSCLTLCSPMDYSPWNSPGQNTGVGSLSLLQGIFPTQGSNPGLPHCRQIFYQLSLKGSRRLLEWVAYPFSTGSSWLRNWTRVSCIAGGFFTNWAIREVCCIRGLPHSSMASPVLIISVMTLFPNKVTFIDTSISLGRGGRDTMRPVTVP